MTLPAQTERCGGSWYTNNLRERKPIPHCFDCLRRTDPPLPHQVWIAPPERPSECERKVNAC
jgi:hypothetical protein